jgi:TrmH family RNA methyltransferase
MIESPHNEKLKLVRKLRDRKHREREGLFATEGEDLLAAGLAAGAAPRFVLVAAGSGLSGEEVDAELLAEVSGLGSGTRAIAVWPLPSPDACIRMDYKRGDGGVGPGGAVVYLQGVGDPGNVGAVVRSAHALLGATVALGPGCADAYGPKAVRGSMGSVFARPPARVPVGETPTPRVGLVAHGGGGLDSLAGAATICLGAEREGLSNEVLAACDATATIPLRDGAESLNVAAAAAVACHISSLAMPEATDA